MTKEVKIQKSHAQDKDGDNNKSRVNISIIRNSLIKHTARSSISRKNNESILSHSGAATEDLTDYVKLSIRKKPDVITTHIGTTDLIKGVNTRMKVKMVVESFIELHRDESIKIGFSSIIKCDDVDKWNDKKKVNDLLQKVGESKGLLIVENSNINSSCLSKSKIHI